MLIEADLSSGNWTDPERGKASLDDYAADWITQRPGLRPRTVDLYRWLLRKHIAPYIGGVPVGKMTAPLVREWRAKLLADGVSVSMAAKAYRLLRAVMTTAVDDGALAKNPCRIRGAADEHAAERPVLTVGQVFELAERIGMRPVGNIRATPDGYRLRFALHGVTHAAPGRYATRGEAERALWKMAGDGRADSTHDPRFRAMVLLATFASLRWGEVTALASGRPRPGGAHRPGSGRVRAASTPGRSCSARRSRGRAAASSASRPRSCPTSNGTWPCTSRTTRARWSSPASWAARSAARTSTSSPGGRTRSRRSACRGCTSTTYGTPATSSPPTAEPGCATSWREWATTPTRAAMIYQHEARGADKAITAAIDAHVEGQRGQDRSVVVSGHEDPQADFA